MTGHDAPDIAFEWTPGFTRSYEISTVGSDFDTVLAVFAEDCSTELDCDDDGGDYPTSAVSGVFDGGETYYIVVKGHRFVDDGSVYVTISPL
jgi:hypothetical protein